MKQIESITIRVTEAQNKKIAKKAEKAGLSKSEYIRKKALNGTERIRSSKEDRARTAALFQIALNELEKELQIRGDDVLIGMLKELQEAGDDVWKL